ncbi:hypothetical protein Tdes44962_MAKER08395 [Teratosphaeria destructans]|uniref:GPI anchored protein n=1 Tax=Teratosphaeria destructans TaxID=418781 RepID=A0A9W7W4I9_9PEZI|nr:hypothetical protein Tdes44962_MAKER08395 [Teratosphaeria destructans]
MRLRTIVATALAAATNVSAQRSDSASMASIVNLPLGGSNSDLVASMITAGPSGTVYAIGCANQTNTAQACGAMAGCYLESSITVTQNESTVHYTWTDDGGMYVIDLSRTSPPPHKSFPPQLLIATNRIAITSSVHVSGGGVMTSMGAPTGSVTNIYPDIRTVGCQLYGDSTITSAVCTGESSIPGAGNKTDSVTLGTKDLSRVAVSVTAGVSNTASDSSSASTTGSATGSKTSGASSATAAGASSSSHTNAAAAPLATVAGYAGAVLAGVAGVMML